VIKGPPQHIQRMLEVQWQVGET